MKEVKSPNLLTAGYLKNVLEAGGLSPNRMLGQNFLVCPKTLSAIPAAAAVGTGDVVLEVGTGIGRLTALLAERAGHVVSAEIDAGLFRIASERLGAVRNVTLLHTDLLESKHRIASRVTDCVSGISGSRTVKVVANLPYRISSPAIINLLEWGVPVSTMHVMLQAEVAERLTALPGGSDYGPLSVFAGYMSETQILFRVPPSAFWPPPEVSSAFVRLRCRRLEAETDDYSLFSRLVNILFQNRRKTLRKGLKIGWGAEKAALVLERSGMSGRLRPQQLAVSDFVLLSNVLAGIV